MGQQQTASVVISKIYLAIASTCLALACSDAAAPAQHVALDVPETVSDTAVAEVFDATVQDAPQTCYSCHGDPSQGNPAPPLGTKGEELPTDRAVGAHQNHLEKSDWHRSVACEECHTVPTALDHSNGKIDFVFSGVAMAASATPSYAADKLQCSGAYCHGVTLLPAKAGGSNEREPIWNMIDGTYNACGTACHTTPPGGKHPQNTNCAQCHGAVIAAFDPATQKATWKDATRHIDGKIDAPELTCTACHGDPLALNPAPPLGTQGETKTTQAAVGAHQNHLQSADWHRQVVCEDCHQKLTDPLHSNGTIDFAFGAVATAMNAQPNFDFSKQTCASTYCHGTTLLADKTGATSLKVPTWTQVDGTAKTCGAACHTTPPGGKHPQNTNCAQCHGAVIAAFDPATQKATWKDATQHVDGKLDVIPMTCTSCHGNPISLDPAPPFGTQGETKTTQAAVGAHQNHLQSADWHRQVVCEDCHQKLTDPLHSNGIIDFAFGAVATAAGAQPAFDFAKQTCTGSYCHGSQLLADKAGAATQRTPVWTQVDGTAKNCGLACHTTPPGDIHPQQTDCESCHDEVVAKFDAVTGTVTWKNAALHINGVVNGGKYHLLAGWTAPKFTANGAVNPEHHGATYFVANQQRDPNGKFCSDCHGSDWAGGKVGVSCSNNGVGCHGANPAGGTAGNWKACNFCHGNAIHNNPPIGVGNESTTATLAVGRHDVHTSASATHIAFQCSRCHTVPATGDVSHTVQYVPSADLSTAGHHGVVTLPAPSTAYNSTGSMAWNVAATSGAPVTARGTCTGACHSDGRGGAPNVTPYWAGGTWTAGSCANCHAAAPSTKHHPDHLSTDNNVPCADCHPDASSASHLNGLRDVKPTILGTPYSGSITVTTGNTSGCATGVHCSGVCHNEAHTNRCW